MCVSGVRDPVADRVPRLPGDAENHCSNGEGDQRVSHVESERDHHGTENDSETDVGVGASVVAIGHEGGALEASTRPWRAIGSGVCRAVGWGRS